MSEPNGTATNGHTHPPDRLLTVREAATYLSLAVSHLYADTRRGPEATIPHVRLGRFVRYRRADLDAYVAARVVGGRPGAPA